MTFFYCRYLASGCTLTDLHYTFRIGISTASLLVRAVCQAIWEVMLSECMPVPTKEQWEKIALHFEKVANFPHCIGAVDGKHIRIICPYKSGSMFYNYKEYYSVVLMAIADSQYRFTYVDIGSFGKDCDSSIFKRARLWTSIETNDQLLPDEKVLPGTGMDSAKVPYFSWAMKHLPYIIICCALLGGRTLLRKKEYLTTVWAELVGMLSVLSAFWPISGESYIGLLMFRSISLLILSKPVFFSITSFVTGMGFVMKIQLQL